MIPGRAALRDLLKRYFGLIAVPSSFERIAAAPSSHIVITQSGSLVVEALLRSFAERSGLGGVTRMGRVFEGGGPADLQPDTLYWETVHEEEALERIRTAYPNACLTTLNVFQGRGPIRNNPSYKMGSLRLLGMLAAPLMKKHFFVVVFGEPFPVVKDAAQRTKLSRRVKLDFFQNLKVVRGVPFQPLAVQERYLLAGHEYERMVAALSKKLGLTEAQVRSRMRREFYRMAAAPRGVTLSLAAWLAKVLTNRLFTEVLILGVDKLRQAAREHPVVLVPMHRSHLDYILLGSVLYESNLNAPLVAAGMNLRFWPVGGFLRSTGAYFVKRGTRNDHIHSFLLQRYITYLIKRGHLQEFFIEGGRSRSGRMMSPKLGLLGIMVNAFAKGVRKEILFVPISISYENVIEDKVYGAENTGQPKRDESVLELLKARKILRGKYGEVIINFGDPVSLAQFAQQAAREDSGETRSKKTVISIASTITERLTEQVSPSLSSLMYTALMMAPNYGLKRERLVATVQNLARIAALMRRLNPALGGFSPSLLRFLEGREGLLYDITRGGVIEIEEAFGTEVFYIPGRKRFVADFYRNHSLHLFFAVSLLSILQLLERPLTPDSAEDLQQLMGERLQILRRGDFKAEMAAVIEVLKSDGILDGREGALSFVNKAPGIFIPALLLGSLESLAWLHFNLLRSKRPAQRDPGEPLAALRYNEFLKKAQNEFAAAEHLGMVHRTESASKSSLILALEASRQSDILGLDSVSQAKSILLYKEPADEFRRLCTVAGAIREWLYASCQRLNDDL